MPALPFDFAAAFPFPLADPPGVLFVGVAEARDALPDPPDLPPLPLPAGGVLGISMFMEVFIPWRTLRLMSS